MPNLIGFFDLAPHSPGFLLPLFRWRQGDNTDLVQVLDLNDQVEDFSEVSLPGAFFCHTTKSVSLEVGNPAVWAFKDHLGSIRVGTSADMAKIATELLLGNDLVNWPILQLELSSFRRDARPDAKLMQAAFRSVYEDSGATAANVWRDTELFAPAVRRDLLRQAADWLTPSEVSQAFVFSDRNLNVFLSSSRLDRSLNGKIEWFETKSVLNAFQLSNAEIRIRPLGELKSSPKKNAPHWTAVGIGGVARYVLGSSAFRGREAHRSERFGPIVQAQGLLSSPEEQGFPNSQFIATCQSMPGQVEFVARQVGGFHAEQYVRHLINVRPFSFGSPQPSKTPVPKLPQLARHFDHIWVLAGHRQRRSGHFRNQLSVSNFASRQVRTLLKSLIRRADLSTRVTRDELAVVPSLNLFGMIQNRSNWSEHEAIRYLLHTMICEEALLHKARKIFVLSPYDDRSRMVEVRLGAHQYKVEIVPDGGKFRKSDLVAWAFSAGLPSDLKADFSDFCISLMDGYGWDHRGSNEGSLLFEDEGEAIRVWPAQDVATISRLISGRAEFGHHADVIVTPQSTPKALIRRAEEMDWTLMHYSELSNWIRDTYGSGRFADGDFDLR